MNKETKMCNYIANLKNIIDSNLNVMDGFSFKRKSKIDSTDLFYYLMQLIENKNNSSVTVSTEMQSSVDCRATDSAFKKKRNLVCPSMFKMMSDDLLQYHYSVKNNLYRGKYRLLAVDGTHAQLSKQMDANYKKP